MQKRLQSIFILLVSVGLLPKFCHYIALLIHLYEVFVYGIKLFINSKHLGDRIMGKIVKTKKCVLSFLTKIKNNHLLRGTWNLEWRCIPTRTLI